VADARDSECDHARALRRHHSGERSGDGITAIKPRKDGDTWRVDLIWETKDVSLFLSNPVLIDDTLYGLSERASGQFFALDARTGRVLWLGPPRQAANTAIVKADHLLFLLRQRRAARRPGQSERTRAADALYRCPECDLGTTCDLRRSYLREGHVLHHVVDLRVSISIHAKCLGGISACRASRIGLTVMLCKS